MQSSDSQKPAWVYQSMDESILSRFVNLQPPRVNVHYKQLIKNEVRRAALQTGSRHEFGA